MEIFFTDNHSLGIFQMLDHVAVVNFAGFKNVSEPEWNRLGFWATMKRSNGRCARKSIRLGNQMQCSCRIQLSRFLNNKVNIPSSILTCLSYCCSHSKRSYWTWVSTLGSAFFFKKIAVHFHTVRNLHFLSENSTLISRQNCRFFGGEKLVKMLWFCTCLVLTTLISREKL